MRRWANEPCVERRECTEFLRARPRSNSFTSLNSGCDDRTTPALAAPKPCRKICNRCAWPYAKFGQCLMARDLLVATVRAAHRDNKIGRLIWDARRHPRQRSNCCFGGAKSGGGLCLPAGPEYVTSSLWSAAATAIFSTSRKLLSILILLNRIGVTRVSLKSLCLGSLTEKPNGAVTF